MSITDARRERRIARIHAELREAQALRQWAANESVRLWAALADEIKQRSPEQVERMERARGLRV